MSRHAVSSVLRLPIRITSRQTFVRTTVTDCVRAFSQTTAWKSDKPSGDQDSWWEKTFAEVLDKSKASPSSTSSSYSTLLKSSPASATAGLRTPPPAIPSFDSSESEPYHLHVYTHKHNTHITLTKPDRDALISVSCGNIGFRKAGRGTYDAAYQLTAWVMNKINTTGLLPKIRDLELVFRGWGKGREAFTKALLGQEGRHIRGKIVRVTDATRLKFGGTRSKKPRRLG